MPHVTYMYMQNFRKYCEIDEYSREKCRHAKEDTSEGIASASLLQSLDEIVGKFCKIKLSFFALQ